MRWKLYCWMTVCVLFGGLLMAADMNPAYTDPKAAGRDFALQGEYAGMVIYGEQKSWGVQVVALGDEKFQFVAYPGGLPGAGAQMDSGDIKRGDGEIRGDSASLFDRTWTMHAKGDSLEVIWDAEVIGNLKKVERKSPTLGAPPPPGAIVLFDGTSANNFENGKLVEGNLLGATNCVSKQKFGDHSLHIEFRTPFMPKSRGQARGNSGVYVQGRYEVQVLDSFGLEGADNECGGIYKASKPNVNMCYPPLSWQTYDIDFTAARYNDAGKKTDNARLTVKHNGVVIHDNLELKSGTPGYKPEGLEKLGLFLQNHGNPVAFRNIWAVEK
jgi:hypothetical protein